MHPIKPGPNMNKSSGHPSLLMSANNPTNLESPSRNNSSNTIMYSDDDLPEDNAINFIKPQNEIFKKLDGKIQKIVAAHSTMNKMYSLNDFSGVGPKKPMELPPQLPRPPPWVPKVPSDYNCSQWAEETLNTLNRSSSSIEVRDVSRQASNIASLNRVAKLINPNPGQIDVRPHVAKPTVLTIDSAISKIHQRRQQQNQQNPQLFMQSSMNQQFRNSLHQPQSSQPRLSTQARIFQQAQELVQQKLEAAAAAKQSQQVRPQTTSTAIESLVVSLPSTSRDEPNTRVDPPKKTIPLGTLLQMQKKVSGNQAGVTLCPNLTPEAKRRFQNELINIFRKEIAAVTKLAKLKFNPQNDDPKINDQRSLLLKKSPQSLFNTIRRETSLLLKRGDPQRQTPTGISLLNNHRQTIQLQAVRNRQTSNIVDNHQTLTRPQVLRFNTIKVIVPPSEFHKHACAKYSSSKDNSSDCNCHESRADLLDIDQWLPSRKFLIKYQTLQMKFSRLKFFPRKDEFNRKKGVCISMTPADARKRKFPQKSLDKIVDRLQARCLSSTSSSPVSQGPTTSITIDSPTSTLQVSREPTPSPPSSPKPIPVFRAAPSSTKANNFSTTSSSVNNSKVMNAKSKKAKRLHHLGLRLDNSLDGEHPTPATEKLTVEQFAKCLNLVRSNDASLQRQQEKLMQSEMKWRSPVRDRPMRLRRIRGERVHMPPSASYRATSKVGLQ